MAQVKLIQYAEISTGTGPVVPIGSKVVPTIISLTGTGEVYHRVWNDAGPTLVVYNGELTALKWFAIKAALETVVSFGDGAHNNTLVLTPNVWQFVNCGETTEYAAAIDDRSIQLQTAITDVYAYNVANCDIEFIGVY